MRLIWSSETNLWEAFGSGDVWVAYAWPNDWVQMKKKKLPVVVHAPEGEADRLGRDVHARARGRRGRPRARVRRRLELAKSAKWLEDNYGYGHANTLARPSSSDLLKALQLDEPEGGHAAECVSRPRHPAARGLRRLWEEVKAA